MNFVEPIRDRKKIPQIKNQLRGQQRYRDLLLLVVGINTALRISDLLLSRIGHFIEDHKRVRQRFWIIYKPMSETDKTASITQLLHKSRNSSKYLLRLMGRSIGITLLAMLLGISFVVITQGVLLLSLRLAVIWKPAFIITSKFVGLEDGEIDFSPISFRWWQIPFWVINLSVHAAVIGFGIWLLFKGGFCDQNFICMLVK